MEKVSTFNYSDIKNELFRLKSREMKTNFFLTEEQFGRLQSQEKIELFKSENSCFLLADDDGFRRVYFIVKNSENILPFLEFLKNQEEEISVEIAGNSKYLSEIKSIFIDNGFYEYSSMVRMSKVRNSKENFSHNNIHLLSDDKKEEIQELYRKYFDKFVERIPTSEELDCFIKNQNAYYFSDNNEIQGFIVFEIHGVTTHLRYWFVHPNYREKKIGSKLISLFFNKGENVKRELFWVITSNENAIKRYKHFGFVEEDMFNVILINKNKKYEK